MLEKAQDGQHDHLSILPGFSRSVNRRPTACGSGGDAGGRDRPGNGAPAIA
jgi:hypothetical protein